MTATMQRSSGEELHPRAAAEAAQVALRGLPLVHPGHPSPSPSATAASDGSIIATSNAAGVLTPQQPVPDGQCQQEGDMTITAAERKRNLRALKAAARAAERANSAAAKAAADEAASKLADQVQPDVGVEASELSRRSAASFRTSRRWSNAGVAKLGATIQELVEVRLSVTPPAVGHVAHSIALLDTHKHMHVVRGVLNVSRRDCAGGIADGRGQEQATRSEAADGASGGFPPGAPHRRGVRQLRDWAVHTRWRHRSLR